MCYKCHSVLAASNKILHNSSLCIQKGFPSQCMVMLILMAQTVGTFNTITVLHQRKHSQGQKFCKLCGDTVKIKEVMAV